MATYGSIGFDNAGNPEVSHQASLQGAGITPISHTAFTNLGPVAASAAQANHVLAEAAAGETTPTPLTDQEVADRFANQTLVADRQAANSTSETFDGNIFNETFLANANVNLTSDLGPGTDTADYFLVERGITAEIGAINTMVTKTYVDDPNIIFADGTATATDTYSNIEAVRGTAADDTFNINSLKGLDSVDGRDVPTDRQGLFYSENDTLTVDPGMGQLTWTFARDADGNADLTRGTVSDGVDTMAFTGIETVGVRRGDITTFEGDVTGVPLDPKYQNEVTPGVPLDTAITRLASAQAELSGTNTPVAQAVAHPDAVEMYANLQNGGVESVPATLTPEMDTEEVATELLSAGARASQEAGIALPEEARAAEAEAAKSAEARSAEARAAEARTSEPTPAPQHDYDDYGVG